MAILGNLASSNLAEALVIVYIADDFGIDLDGLEDFILPEKADKIAS